MITATVRAVRDSLNRYLEGWRRPGGDLGVVYVGLYGTPEAILAPLPIWDAVIRRLAVEIDRRSVGQVQQRLAHGAGPAPTTLVELARLAGVSELPIPVLRNRGMPRGSTDLSVWTPAVSDVRAIAENPAAASAALRVIAEVTLDRAPYQASHAGQGVRLAVSDVDGMHAVLVTYRPAPRPDHRGGMASRPVVELIGVDSIRWFEQDQHEGPDGE
ncbi:hypothetical protein QTQ03_28325 [Micromonospora sp. WMMA1363]|uniref:hypothetical protein n=1 Tax=Micromonospora sp. WMMA1363 TaxID=3053985 RepID=UPI00259D1FD2|nr:hypothetical protein [Micromonospora sp. WMMA1363]MDM4723314.1 hypothetical protein [Micromonospora sp. WMMA1363]